MLTLLSLDTPLPTAITILPDLQAVVRKGVPVGADTPAWRQSQSSWRAVWGQEAFGVGPTGRPVDTSYLRFRVSPDADVPSVGGKTPFVVEVYEGGFPTYGIRRDGSVELCRPLGFRYDRGGLCANATVYVREGGRWRRRDDLSREARTRLARLLTLNGFDSPSGPGDRTRSSFGEPWIRLEAEGYGSYWIDRGLNCVAPFGSACRLYDDVGRWIEDDLKPPIRRR